jgi:hypothetical protein
MNFNKSINTSEYHSKKEKYQNKFYNSLMNKYMQSHKIPINRHINKETNNQNILSNSNNSIEAQDKFKPITQKRNFRIQNYNANTNVYNFDKPNIQNKSISNQNSKFTIKLRKDKDINNDIINETNNNKMKKINKKIINIKNNRINRLSYSKPSNNQYFFAEEPFLLDDKVINNSFINNQEDIIKNKNFNNNDDNFIKYNIILNNDSSSKMLDNDAPSSLNNSKRLINSKNDLEETNNYFDNISQKSQNIFGSRNKKSIGSENKSLETVKIRKPIIFINTDMGKTNKSFNTNYTNIIFIIIAMIIIIIILFLIQEKKVLIMITKMI